MTKNRKVKIFIMILIILFTVFVGGCNKCYAGPHSGIDDNKELEGGMDPLYSPGTWEPKIEGDSNFFAKVGIILAVINTVGIIVSVVVLAIIGLKYMFGSVEERADYKKSMIPYVIGVTLLAAGSTIPNIIYNFMN